MHLLCAVLLLAAATHLPIPLLLLPLLLLTWCCAAVAPADWRWHALRGAAA
jgi:hypothetical protein